MTKPSHDGFTYTLYNFKIRQDVNSSRLCTSLRIVNIKHTCFAMIPCTTCMFHDYSPKVHILLVVTSHLISELDRVYYMPFILSFGPN